MSIKNLIHQNQKSLLILANAIKLVSEKTPDSECGNFSPSLILNAHGEQRFKDFIEVNLEPKSWEVDELIARGLNFLSVQEADQLINLEEINKDDFSTYTLYDSEYRDKQNNLCVFHVYWQDLNVSRSLDDYFRFLDDNYLLDDKERKAKIHNIRQCAEWEAEEMLRQRMEVTNTEIFEWEGKNVHVMVETVDYTGKFQTFFVQTNDGVYRSDLGCWITTDGSNGDIGSDNNYPTFSIQKVIEAAEKYLKTVRSELLTDYKINHEDVYLIEQNNEFIVVTRNSNFINPDSSSYQEEFSDPITFCDSKEEAIEYLDELVTNNEATKN